MTKRNNNSDYAQDAAHMEQVRELLFGTQMKEVNTHFQRQDEQFERKITDVRESLKTRLDSCNAPISLCMTPRPAEKMW
jgi:hypothetical protein